MKKTENVNLLILGSRTDPGFITTLNKMLWSATGASKPMDQKSNTYTGAALAPKSRSQKNSQVPVLKVRSQFRSQLKFLQGTNIFEPKQWMIACTTTSFMFSFMYKWSGFVCTNVNVCIVLLFFISISSSKTKRFI